MRKQIKRRRHNDPRGERRLHLECLESRRLLASDAAEIDFASQSLSRQASLPSHVASNNAQTFRSSDAAGNTLDTAANLGVVEGTLKKRGSLSWFDRIDLVRFEIQQDSQVRFTLDQLSRDADLAVLDESGQVIGSSSHASTRGEALAGTLRSGRYFLAITAGSFWSSTYRLTLQVNAINSEVSKPSSPTNNPGESPKAPPAPSTIGPLSDVSYFGDSNDWNLNAVGAPESWAAGFTGQGITVAVIDTGVDLDHPELTQALYVNPGEIAGNGIDDDRNGFVDDVSGYDFVANDAYADDGNGHGTHVAGTIAAANDGRGVTGVAPDAKILPVRVLDDNGSGSDSSVAAGIRYAAEMGAEIINLSLGGGASARITAAIEYAISLGALVVAAAGNDSAATPSHPAQHSAQIAGVISVGAFDSSGNLSNFSNRVGNSGAVQIDGPGSKIYSTYSGGGYQTLSGTSMAAPHVAAVAALTLSANPDLTSPQLRQLLSTLTVGKASGSDSLGKISALYSVAYADAGLTQARSRPPHSTSSESSTHQPVSASHHVNDNVRTTRHFIANSTTIVNDGAKTLDLIADDPLFNLTEIEKPSSQTRQASIAAIDAVFSHSETQQTSHSRSEPETPLRSDLGHFSELAESPFRRLRAA